MKKYAVIGFGCAGYQALCALRERDASAEIHVFSELGDPPANPMLTTYYAAGRLPYEGLFPFGALADIEERLRPVLHMNTEVTAVDGEKRILRCGDAVYGPFDGVLLATGARPLVPPLGASVGNRVLCMRTVQDAKALKERLEQGSIRSVTVVGASMVGIKVLELCYEAGLACTLAARSENIFSRSAFPDVSDEIKRRLESRGVKLCFGSDITAAEETDEKVITCFASGLRVESDLLVLCVGTEARTELAEAAGLTVNQGIAVNERMETAFSGVYAAGDCCEGRNLMTGGGQVIGLWANAAGQGRTAGSVMGGGDVSFAGSIPHNITHFMGMDFVSFGDVKAEGEVYAIGTPEDDRYVKAIVAEGELRCVNLLDNYHISGVVKQYMMSWFSGERTPLSMELRGLLFREGFTDEFLMLFEGGNKP